MIVTNSLYYNCYAVEFNFNRYFYYMYSIMIVNDDSRNSIFYVDKYCVLFVVLFGKFEFYSGHNIN